MGSPISLLLWVLCFDPLIHGLQTAVGACAPTYVDDLAVLVHGPRQATLAAHCLVRLSSALGLHLEHHSCRSLSVTQLQEGAISRMANLPVTCRHAEGGWEITGVDPRLLDRLLSRSMGQEWAIGK
eukprot:4226440-Prorocentrum_lima.AAC.1